MKISLLSSNFSRILKGNDEMKAVKTAVQQEMKSYSSVVSKSCSTALSPNKLEAVVRKVAAKEDMSKNAIIYGLTENENEKLQEKVDEVLTEIGEKPRIKDCCRVGIKRVGGTRPIKFTLNSSDHVAQILRSAKQLRTKAGYSGIYICPDRTAHNVKLTSSFGIS